MAPAKRRESFGERIAYFLSHGFFFELKESSPKGRTERLEAAYQDRWDEKRPPPGPAGDLRLLSLDSERVCVQTLLVEELAALEGRKTYVQLLRELGRITKPFASLTDAREKWKSERGPVALELKVNGRPQRLRASHLDGFLDLEVLFRLNASLEKLGGRWVVIEDPDEPLLFIVTLTPELAQRFAHERGWVPASASDLLYPLGIFYESRAQPNVAARIYEKLSTADDARPDRRAAAKARLLALGRTTVAPASAPGRPARAGPAKNPRMSAKARAELGEAQLSRGDSAAALRSFEQALSADRKLRRAWKGKGLALVGLGDLQGASEAFEQAAAECNPKSDYYDRMIAADALFDQGKARVSLRELDGAVSSFRRATELNDWHFRSWFLLSNVLADLGNADEAQRVFTQAMEIGADLAHGWLRKGEALAALGRSEEALATFARHSGTDGIRARASLLDELGRFEESLPLWRQLAPSSLGGGVWHRVGSLELMRSKDLGLAREALTRAAEGYQLQMKRDREPKLRVALADVLALIGRSDEALRLLAEAVEADEQLVGVIAADPELASLRSSAAFRKLIGKLPT